MRSVVDEVMLPPQAPEAEQSVLGALLLNNAAWERVHDVVTEQDFYRVDHRHIFRAIAQLIDAGQPADALTVSEALTAAGMLEDVGGTRYLGALAVNTHSIANVRQYAQIVRDRSQKRQVIAVATQLASDAYQSSDEAAGLVEEAISQLYRLQVSRGRGSRPIGAVLSAVVEKIDALYAREDKHAVVGIASGFVDLDRMTAGFQPGDLIVIAGRPSMGKTALAMNVVEHVAVDLKLPALIFSLEMSDEQLVQRMIGSVGRMDQHELRTGQFREDDWSRLTQTVGVLNESSIIIEDTGGLTVSDVRARAHGTYRERGSLGVIVIDYLQLMQTTGENRNNEIGEITRALKELAKELRVPVIALSQLNRGVEQRANKRPVMSDLRDSGSIEQDADLILLIYRDEVYDSESPRKGIAEIIIGKHRSGPIGTVNLTFLSKYTRFENFAGELAPWRPKRQAVSNFNDYKSRAAGE